MILSDHYLTFVKDQVEMLAPAIAQTNVYVRYHPVTEISRLIPSARLKAFRKDTLIDRTNMPGNVSVTPVPILYLPCEQMATRVEEQYYTAVVRNIRASGSYPDCIHAHFVWPNGVVGVKLKKAYDIPFVVTAHGYDVYDLPFRNARWKERIETVLNSADTVITVSNNNQKCIEKLNVTTPVTVIPNGFRSDLFYPSKLEDCRNTLHLPLDRKIILSVGNLTDVKGQRYLIDAMAEVVREHTDILCLIVGRGELRSTLESRITSLGLNQYVRLVGGKPHTEIPTWMNACDLFVLPSLQESFGVVQVEAMACGKPVIATRNGGSEEIVIPWVNGALCDCADPHGLAKTIVAALDTSWDAGVIATGSERYTWTAIGTEILRRYQSTTHD